MNRVLLIVGGVLVGLLTALFLVPVFVDWNRYRGVFEEEASRLLGREVRVARVNMRLLPSPFIRFEKVRVADTQATVGEPLFRADDLTIWLAISPLFSGNFEATEMEVRKPVVTLVLDDKGSGNWSTLAERPNKAMFVPRKVALDRVRVNNGTVAILNASGELRGRLEHVNGELSAAALDGPYRFAVAFSSDGAPREIRLSTAKAEQDGSVRLKGTLRTPQSGASYTVEGLLQDVLQKPRLIGEITARLPLPADEGGKATADASYELKGQLDADTAGARFKDLALSFEQDGKPQLATGEAQVAFQPQLKATVDLASRWLDLDRIGARGPKTTLPELLQRFIAGLEAKVPQGIEATARITLEQATLGGEIASGIAILLERQGQALKVQASAGLPGNGRLQAVGQLTSASPDALFAGDISLRGANLTRFAAWVGRNTSLAAIQQDSPFVITGRVALGPDRVSGRNLVLQLAGNNVTGDVSWTLAGPVRQMTVSLEGPELDLTPLMNGKSGAAAALLALRQRLSIGPVVGSLQGAAATPPDAEALNIAARLRIGRVVAGRSELRDVVADLTLANGNLSLPALKVGSHDGWSLDLRGDLAGLAKSAATGLGLLHCHSRDSLEPACRSCCASLTLVTA